LNGWVYEAHVDGYQAGIYGNPAPASMDFSQVSPAPDQVWIAKYDGRVTTLGLGSLSDSVWASDQRIHQYTNSHGETWGGVVASAGIDNDLIDSQIVIQPGVFRAKAMNFNVISTYDYPGALSTLAAGINNQAQVVGYYEPNDSSVLWGGFFYNGTFAPVGASNGQAFQINNLGHITGYNGDNTSFLDVGGTFTTITAGGIATFAYGLNDNDQVVGEWDDDTNSHAFIYSNGGISSFDYSGDVTETVYTGINGVGHRVGTYVVSDPDTGDSYWHGFVDRNGALGNLDYPGAGYTMLNGINNDDQVTGSSDVCGAFIYDFAVDAFTCPDNLIGEQWNLSDYGQAAGEAGGSSSYLAISFE
jgi:probable HAF family extracellular repeat protein